MNLKTGSVIQVDCTGMGHNGEGVCRFDGLALFVPLVLPGEKAKIEVVEVKKRYGVGRLIEIIEPSAERVTPRCTYYGSCGGCQLQHLSYSGQLRHKKQMVKDAFERIGRLESPIIHDVLGMAEPWNYRNKMQLPVGKEKQELLIGCYQRGSHKVIDTLDCLIQSEWNNRLLKKIRKFLQEIGAKVYSEKNHQGWLRHVMGRTNKDGEALLVIVATSARLPGGRARWQKFFQELENVKGILLNVNSKVTNTVLGNETITVAGEGSLTETLGDLRFSLSGTAFFQVNPSQTEVLYDKVVEFAGLTGSEKVLDAYCGTGTIALYLAPRSHKVIGIERHKGAVEDAQKNAEENGIGNCEFWAGDVEHYLAKIKEMQPDIVVIDPPRSGCSPEMLAALNDTGIKKLVYVSCNPSTLARDVAWLVGRGWEIKEVQPVDMFPQTAHVEAVIKLSLKNDISRIAVAMKPGEEISHTIAQKK